MTKEQAQKAKAAAAEDFAKGYQEAQKRFGVDPSKGKPPPEVNK